MPIRRKGQMDLQLSDEAKTSIARITLLGAIKRRVEQADLQAAEDVRKALIALDMSDWVSCLRAACLLADQCERMVVA
jgi:hypothetical protein